MPVNCKGLKKDAYLWVAVGDIHDETDNFAKIPELAEADGIIVSGDITQLGGIAAAKKVLQKLGESGLPILAQIGNMDHAEIDEWLDEKGINLHCQVRELAPGVAIFGIGASTPTPFNTPSEFPEESYAQWLAQEWARAGQYPHAVLVSHNPPKNTPCDEIPGGAHVGSIAVREFLEKCHPDVCICGHIHEGRALARVCETEVVNPGPLAAGGYALLRLQEGQLFAELATL